MKGIPEQIIEIKITRWLLNLSAIRFMHIQPSINPIPRQVKRKVKSVYGREYLLERKGIKGPGAAIMDP